MVRRTMFHYSLFVASLQFMTPDLEAHYFLFHLYDKGQGCVFFVTLSHFSLLDFHCCCCAQSQSEIILMWRAQLVIDFSSNA